MSRFALLGCALAFVASGCGDTGPKNTGREGGTGNPKTSWDRNSPPPPCHPGCFPAGTLVATPTGPRAVDTIRAGDAVTLIGTDGTAVGGPVHSTFCAENRLF